MTDKTGELDINTHDAGIVYTDFGDYIIVIFSESDSREQAKEQIATISKAVYQYFEKGDTIILWKKRNVPNADPL